MSLLTPSERNAQTAVAEAVRSSYRSDAEIAMRDVLELWSRERFPAARLFHELVMGRGSVRADVAAISPAHIAAFEIKGPFDTVDRLLHQIAMFRLAVPELWIVTAGRHSDDAKIIRHLLPSVGLIEIVHRENPTWDTWAQSAYRAAWQGEPGTGKVDRDALRVEVVAEASPFAPDPNALLSLCWVAELQAEAGRRRVSVGARASHAKLVEAMAILSADEKLESVCRQLRGRETMFRADAPVKP